MDMVDKWFIGFLIALVGIFIMVLSLAIKSELESRAACEAAGGYHLSFRGGSECVDRNIIIKVQP